jgi:hypothetical protein
VRSVSRLCEFYPGICLTTEEKARKNLSQGKKNLSQNKKALIHPLRRNFGTIYFESCVILCFSFCFITYIIYIYIQLHSKCPLFLHRLLQFSCFSVYFRSFTLCHMDVCIYRNVEWKKHRKVLSHSAVLFDIYGKVLFVYPDSLYGCLLTAWKGQ